MRDMMVSWDDAMARLCEQLGRANRPWHGIEVRILAWPTPTSESRETLSPFIIYAQGLFDAVPESTLVPLVDHPLILGGRIAEDDFPAFLRIVQGDGAVRLDGYQIEPWHAPELVHTVSVHEGQEMVQGWLRLLEPVVVGNERPNPYGTRISGAGSESPVDLTNSLAQAASVYDFGGMHRVTDFSAHYLGLAIQGIAYGPWVCILLPEPIWLSASVERPGRLRARLWYRPPVDPRRFWVRASSAKWTLQLPKHSWGDSVGEESNWSFVEASIDVELDATTYTVWAGEGEAPDLTATVALSPETQERQQFGLLRYLYQWAKREFTSDLLPTGPIAAGANYFEIAVANLLAALGYATISTGVPIRAKGVDIVAFDASRGVALVISVTTGNDVASKLITLLAAQQWMNEALSSWERRYIIVTSAEMSAVTPSALTDCKARAVVVLMRGDLVDLVAGDSDAVRSSREERLGLSVAKRSDESGIRAQGVSLVSYDQEPDEC